MKQTEQNRTIGERKISGPIRRILIVQTAFIGDVILTLPLLQKTRDLFPAAEVDFVAIPAVGNLLETVPEIRNLWIYDKRGKDRGLRGFWRLLERCRKRRYDLALVPHRSLRSAALVRLSGIPRRIGFDRSAGRFLFTEVIPYPWNTHEINRNLHLLRPFGVDPAAKIFPRLHFTAADTGQVEQWLQVRKIPADAPLVAIAPGSVWATKRWLPEYFAKLAEMFANAGFCPVLIGGKGDASVGQAVLAATSEAIPNAIGAFTLRESALLIRKSRLLVTNDSAPMHLAVGTQTPVVAIFGPTVPAFGFYPYGENDRVVEVAGLSCRPCGKHGGNVCPIGTFACMKGILPQQVFAQAISILENQRNNAALG